MCARKLRQLEPANALASNTLARTKQRDLPLRANAQHWNSAESSNSLQVALGSWKFERARGSSVTSDAFASGHERVFAGSLVLSSKASARSRFQCPRTHWHSFGFEPPPADCSDCVRVYLHGSEVRAGTAPPSRLPLLVLVFECARQNRSSRSSYCRLA